MSVPVSELTKNKSDISEDFKKDVITAEKLTDGDIHILSRDKFSSSGRQKYDELFGSARKPTSKPNAKRKLSRPSEDSPKPKASKYSDLFPDTPSKSRRPATKPKKPTKPAAESPRPNITHPRFIAENDHKIRILAPDSPEARTVAPSASDPYRCSQCGFTTARLNVLVLHNKTHVAAAAAKPTTAKRKNASEAGEGAPKKKKKRPTAADGTPIKVAKASKTACGDGSPKKSAKPSPKKSAPGTPKKTAPGTPNKSAPGTPKKTPKKDGKTEADKLKTPVKLSPLKPAQSSRPLLLEDWDEDDAEEEAERAKIQSEIDRFISVKNTPKKEDASGASTSAAASASGSAAASPGSPGAASAEATPEKGVKEEADAKEENVDKASLVSTKPNAEHTEAREGSETAPEAEPEATEVAVPEPPTNDDDAAAAAMRQQQRERNDALLQAAVDDVLADTAPDPLPTLPSMPSAPSAPAERTDAAAALSRFDFSTEPEPEPVAPRPRPVRVCPAGSPLRRHVTDATATAGDGDGAAEDVTSSRPTPTSSADGPPTSGPPTSTLPPNLQILSMPGSDGQPDTYVLVSMDERGNVQPVNPLDNLGGLGADTLLAYEVAQEDGSTRTAYLNPASLSTSADIKQLLGADEKVDSTTPVPDSSGN